MPTYEYSCQKCKTVFEKKMTVAEKSRAKIICPACKAEDVSQVFFGLSITDKKTGGGNDSGGCCCGGKTCC